MRGQANPRQEHGHYLGKYHELSNDNSMVIGDWNVTEEQGAEAPAAAGKRRHEGTKGEGKKPVRVFEDDRARMRLTPRRPVGGTSSGATRFGPNPI